MIVVTILIPALPIESEMVAHIRARATELFGGCTVEQSQVTGAWLDAATKLYDEPMRRLKIAVDGFQGLALASAFAREVGNGLDEQAVYMEALGCAEIINCNGGK